MQQVPTSKHEESILEKGGHKHPLSKNTEGKRRMIADFSLETMEAAREWNNIFNALREKAVNSTKISFKKEKDFSQVKKKEEFVTSRTA